MLKFVKDIDNGMWLFTDFPCVQKGHLSPSSCNGYLLSMGASGRPAMNTPYFLICNMAGRSLIWVFPAMDICYPWVPVANQP